MSAGVEIDVSPPIISVRETITSEPRRDVKVQKTVSVVTPDERLTLTFKALPLPETISSFLYEQRASVDQKATWTKEELQDFHDKLKCKFDEAGKKWARRFAQIWDIAPLSNNCNILFNNVSQFHETSYWTQSKSRFFPSSLLGENEVPKDPEMENRVIQRNETLLKMADAIVSGFKLATSSGPLCEEPMMDVCIILEDFSFDFHLFFQEISSNLGPVISCAKDGVRAAFETKSARILEAVYNCEIQVSQDHLGKTYALLGKRRAKVFNEQLKHGTNIFGISAYLPVIESFGFYSELVEVTSGAANAQLVFHGWRKIDKDPFFVPKTEEELEEYGETIALGIPNLARDVMNKVRKSKGLKIDEKLVQSVDKQRTLSKNK